MRQLRGHAPIKTMSETPIPPPVEVLTSTTLDRARQIVQRAHAISPSAGQLRLEQQLRQGDSNARQLVLTSLIVSRRAANRSPREALAAARLTGDAVRAAVVGKTLAQMARSADPDTAFAAGLLHDLGHVYLLDDVGERYASYLLDPHAHDARNAAGQLEMEIELAGTTHQDVGAVFAYEWELPPVIARVLWDHHVPSPGSLGALIAGADVLVRELSYPAVVAAVDQQLEGDTVLVALNISRERWEERTSSVRESFSELLSIFVSMTTSAAGTVASA